MRGNLYDKENSILEKFEIQSNDNPKSFIENKCPINLKDNNYIKLNNHFGKKGSDDKEFMSSKIVDLFDIGIFDIILAMFFSLTFYDLLITFIIYGDLKLLIYFIIVYILASLVQFLVVPNPIKFKPKQQLEEGIKKILNSHVIFKLSNYGNKKAMYQAKYTIDISGTLNIPKDYGYAKINEVQLFTKKEDMDKFVKNFEKVYESKKIDYKLMYQEDEIKFNSTTIYSLDSEKELFSINNYTSFFSIFLLQWLNAIYYKCSKSKKCIKINFAKLLTSEPLYSPTKFTIHGKKCYLNLYVENPIEKNEEFEKDWEKYESDLKEKKEREAEEERNTKTLSYFENGNNFTIEVKRVYDIVHLRFDAYTKERHSWHKRELGYYDRNIKEKIVVKDKMTIYYPNGYDIRIEVIRGLYSYTVTIGDDYTETFDYNHK